MPCLPYTCTCTCTYMYALPYMHRPRLTTSSIAEKVLNNLTTTPSHPLTTSLSEETEEPSGVDPTYPPGEIEPLISISIFLIFILLGE